MSNRRGHIFQTGVVCKETHAGDSVTLVLMSLLFFKGLSLTGKKLAGIETTAV